MDDLIHVALQVIGMGVAAYALPYLVTRGVAAGIRDAGTISIEWRKLERRQ